GLFVGCAFSGVRQPACIVCPAAFCRKPRYLLGITMSTIPLTTRGADRLRAELKQLKTIERPQVIDAIAEARAQGDLSENAEYDAARERQAFVEARIKELDGTLSNAQIIEPSELDVDGKAVF